MDFSFGGVQITHFTVFVMLVENLILMTESQSLDTTFILGQILSLGLLISKKLCYKQY